MAVQAILPVSTAEDISNLSLLRSTFRSQRTKPLEYRLFQLRSLYWALHDNSSRLVEACYLDSGKPGFESLLSEVDWCKNEIVFMSRNLETFMKDENAPDMPWEYKAMSPIIRKEPLGTVLIIGPYNFPVQLAITPLIGAIAAGCTAVLKPSEMAVNTAAVLTDIISKCLDPTAYAIVNGAVPETTALLAQKWDKIFFTGSVEVGSIVARKAAETLTPVTLELGGRNAAVVSKNANIRLAARRLLWGKLMNVGQMCVSENYVMVEREVCDQLLSEMKSSMHEFFPAGCRNSPDFGRIINHRHFHRIKKMLDYSEGEIIYGGDTDEASKYIGLTVVKVKSKNDSLLASESFGPIIAVLEVGSLDEAVEIANEIHSTPLAFYPFGTPAETSYLLSHINSGGATIGDSFFHCCLPTLPFGGIGDSGTGSYRGRWSFETFSHRRSIITVPDWMEVGLKIRYPPYEGKMEAFRVLRNLEPDFGRDCRTKHWLGEFFVGWFREVGKWLWLTCAVFVALSGWKA